MTVYYFTLLSVFVFAALSKLSDNKISSLDEKGTVKHGAVATFFFILVVAVLVFVSGNRYYVGADFGAYYSQYEIFAERLVDSIKEYDEPGFKFICWIVVLLNGDGHDVIMLTSLITLGLYLITLYKNTDRQITASLLFIFLGCWHVSFNAVRQCLAAAILFTGISALRNKKFLKYFIIVFIASLFHKTAIVLLIIYFVVNRKISAKNVFLLIVISVLILFSFDTVFEFTSFLLEDAHSEELTYSTASVNTLRILVACAPPVYIGLFNWKKEYNERETFAMNLLLLNAVFMLSTSNSTYFARLGIYSAPFVAVSLPEMLRVIDGKFGKIAHVVIILLYALYWLYEVTNSGSLNPFTFIWQA